MFVKYDKFVSCAVILTIAIRYNNFNLLHREFLFEGVRMCIYIHICEFNLELSLITTGTQPIKE